MTMQKPSALPTDGISLRAVLHVIFSIVFARGMESLHIPQTNRAIFYSLAFMKYFFVFYVIVMFMVQISYHLFPKKRIDEKSR